MALAKAYLENPITSVLRSVKLRSGQLRGQSDLQARRKYLNFVTGENNKNLKPTNVENSINGSGMHYSFKRPTNRVITMVTVIESSKMVAEVVLSHFLTTKSGQ